MEELADALQKRIEVEDGGELAADLVEDGEGLGLPRNAGVEAGVFDGLTDARGGELEKVQMFRLKVVELFGLDVDDAD
jgi:hypothetical protein